MRSVWSLMSMLPEFLMSHESVTSDLFDYDKVCYLSLISVF